MTTIANNSDIFLYPGVRVQRLVSDFGIRFDSESETGLVNLFISEGTFSTGSDAIAERVTIIDSIVEELQGLRAALLKAAVK